MTGSKTFEFFTLHLQVNFGKYKRKIAQFRYIHIKPQTIDFSTRLWGIKYRVCGVYSPEPHSDVYCLRLTFRISKLGYYPQMENAVMQLLLELQLDPANSNSVISNSPLFRTKTHFSWFRPSVI